MVLTFTKYKNRKTTIGEEVAQELGDFSLHFANPIITKETTAEFMALSKDEQSVLKDRGGYIAGTCQGTRGKGCVINRTAITLDLDEGDILTADNIKSRCHYKYFLHSTRKHTKKHPRYRLIVPLAEPVEAKLYEVLARTLANDIGILDNTDPTTFQAERMMYWPTISSDGKENFVFIEGNGELLKSQDLLARYTDPLDMSCYPRASKETSKVKTLLQNTELQDPLCKPGLIGAFNRAYPIREAIAKFLDNVYEPTPYSTDRYTYTEGSSTGGLVIYDNYAYSHHSTDPACEQLCHAFDLVRIHLFGDEDLGIDTTTPIMKMPSMQAMLDLARNDEKVKAEVLNVPEGMEQDYGLLETPADIVKQSNTDWQKDLTFTKNGTLENSLSNFAEILRHDQRLQGICKNEMTGSIITTKKLPWKNTLGSWSNDDYSQLNTFLDNAFHIYSPQKTKDALITVAAERSFHPLKFYLSKVIPAWDRTPRLETLLIDYLGAENNEYVRAVTRKTLIAAVSRVFNPGIKFDNVLVLVGSQGIGKSTIFAKLANQYFCDTLTLTDMQDKTAAEKIAGYWIVELAELAGRRNADMELVKSFITRCDDAYRPAYGAVVDKHPRQCIIVGTTNREEGFLYDTTGNRRFWPVKVTGQSSLHPWDLTEETIEQLWAEAKFYYDNHESLYLDPVITALATKEQEDMLVKDERLGFVEQWLDDGNYNEISGIEVWINCLNNERKSYNRSAQVAMAKILKSLTGWHEKSFSIRGEYGKQRTFKRTHPEQKNLRSESVPFLFPEFSPINQGVSEFGTERTENIPINL